MKFEIIVKCNDCLNSKFCSIVLLLQYNIANYIFLININRVIFPLPQNTKTKLQSIICWFWFILGCMEDDIKNFISCFRIFISISNTIKIVWLNTQANEQIWRWKFIHNSSLLDVTCKNEWLIWGYYPTFPEIRW